MKKINYLGMMMAAAAITACTSDELVNAPNTSQTAAKDNVIGFSVNKKNMTRAGSNNMQDLGIYGFGVWAIKTTDSGTQDVMENYLVGYYDEENSKGYYGGRATTIGDVNSNQDGYSMWFYEGLGNPEYEKNYAYVGKPDGFKTVSPSIHPEQYLKYWDVNSQYTEFWAYTPYELSNDKNEDGTDKVWLSKSNGKLIVGKLWAGFDDQEKYEYLLAYRKYTKGTDYSEDFQKDVEFTFERINAKVNLAFYETIAGYDVNIKKLSFATAHNAEGAPASEASHADTDMITVGGYYKKEYDNSIEPLSTEEPSLRSFNFGEITGFGVPKQTYVADKGKHTAVYLHIATTRDEAFDATYQSQCPGTYYALPASKLLGKKNSGFILKVEYTLFSHDTNETLDIVSNVYVAPEYVQWLKNTHYTYVFRITRDAQGLYPIVFDGIQVQDYDEVNQYEWIINADGNPTDYVAIAHTLPATINGTGATEFSVTCYQNPDKKVTGNIRAIITVDGVSDVTKKIATLEYEETDPAKGLGWKSMLASRNSYGFENFPIADATPLKLRLTPASSLNSGDDIKAIIKIMNVAKTETYGTCTISTKIK